MPEEPNNTHDSLIPPQPIPAGARAFKERIHGLMDGQAKDEATVAKALEGMDEMLEVIAAGLYTLASMLVGEGEESVRLVEKAIATAEVSACHDMMQARQSSRRALCTAALEVLARREPGCLDVPAGLERVSTCIEDDELDSAGVSSEELETMLGDPDKGSVRNWLESLSTELRVVFALRAVAGFTANETATLLADLGGPGAKGWSADAVRETFRQGLCSLASQLIHATGSR